MGDIHYMISEAAKCVGVESHVLRYWEEELELPIERTEMGHRYYTKDDIQLFHCIRKLKDEGVLLKELKVLIPQMRETKKQRQDEENRAEKVEQIDKLGIIEKVNKSEKSYKRNKPIAQEHKVEAVKSESLGALLQQALLDNNVILEAEIGNLVTESMRREMTYILDAKEQLEEDRYRKLDTLIRQQQVSRKESVGRKVPHVMKQLMGYN